VTSFLILLAIIIGILLAAALPFWHLRRKPPPDTGDTGDTSDTDDADDAR
jgi:branched-subunit amino acid transport protein AzlD